MNRQELHTQSMHANSDLLLLNHAVRLAAAPHDVLALARCRLGTLDFQSLPRGRLHVAAPWVAVPNGPIDARWFDAARKA